MDRAIFTLCTITAGLCAFFLLRGYLRTHTRLLLWSGICFFLLSVSNALLTVDRWLFPEIDMTNPRLFTTLAGVLLLIYGLVWERE